MGSTNKAGFGIPRWLKYTLGVATVVVAFYFLGTRLVRDWHQIPFDRLHFSLPLLVLSFVVLLGTHLPLASAAWQVILSGLGERIPLGHSIAVFSVTQLGKYVPGKLWFTLGRMSILKREGISEAKTMVSVVVEIILALLASLLLLGMTVLFVPRSTIPSSVYLLLLLAPVCVLLVYPRILNGILRFVLRRAGRPVFELRLSYLQLLLLTGMYFADWAMQGFGSFLLLNSFYPLSFAKLPVVLGGYAISWMIGFLMLVAPAGLGIREGIFTLILKMVLPEPIAIISTLLTRVWMTISEAAVALFCLPFLSRRRKNAEETEARPV